MTTFWWKRWCMDYYISRDILVHGWWKNVLGKMPVYVYVINTIAGSVIRTSSEWILKATHFSFVKNARHE